MRPGNPENIPLHTKIRFRPPKFLFETTIFPKSIFGSAAFAAILLVRRGIVKRISFSLHILQLFRNYSHISLLRPYGSRIFYSHTSRLPFHGHLFRRLVVIPRRRHTVPFLSSFVSPNYRNTGSRKKFNSKKKKKLRYFTTVRNEFVII